MSRPTIASTELAPGLAVFVNGAGSSGKSTLCRELQGRLTELTDGDFDRVYASVAVDDRTPGRGPGVPS